MHAVYSSIYAVTVGLAVHAQVAFSFDAVAVAAVVATRRGTTPLGQPLRDTLILQPNRRLSLCAGSRMICHVSVGLPPLAAFNPYARFSHDRDPRRSGENHSSAVKTPVNRAPVISAENLFTACMHACACSGTACLGGHVACL